LPFDCKVNIKVYDVSGRVVASLIDSEKKSGSYSFAFNASGLNNGIYFYKLETVGKEGGYAKSGKILKQ